MLGLARGDRVTARVVPRLGVEEARKADGRWDGRGAAAELLARSHEQPHDLVLIAVPPGKGERVTRDLAEALEALNRG